MQIAESWLFHSFFLIVFVMLNKFKSCFECGGKCCKFFSVPEEFKNKIHTEGIPLEFYAVDPRHNPQRYFELHQGIHISGDGKRFHAGAEVKTCIMDTRFGRHVIIYSQCSKLGENSHCEIYEDRPLTCRLFDERTVEYYNVPSGCIYDPGGYGEDFGV